MDKIQLNKLPKGKAMEFKQKDEVVIVDEKITTVFEAAQVKAEPVSEYPCTSKDKGCSKRWLESLSDCA
jgi:hypothetical protein